MLYVGGCGLAEVLGCTSDWLRCWGVLLEREGVDWLRFRGVLLIGWAGECVVEVLDWTGLG